MININETGFSESFDLMYSEIKKSVYFRAVMFSNILLSTLV